MLTSDYFYLLHFSSSWSTGQSQEHWTEIQRGRAYKRNKKKRRQRAERDLIQKNIDKEVSHKKREYKDVLGGRVGMKKLQNPVAVLFCQENKEQLNVAATYQHSEQECKSALMQMSYVFRGNTRLSLYQPPTTTTHFSLCKANPASHSTWGNNEKSNHRLHPLRPLYSNKHPVKTKKKNRYESQKHHGRDKLTCRS